jgi:CRISPR-associated endonuclease/helicase Cas3
MPSTVYLARPHQPLDPHLRETAKGASRRLNPISPEAALVGEMAGGSHDWAKYHPPFQDKVRGTGKGDGTRHDIMSAHLLREAGYRYLPRIVGGHHRGLGRVLSLSPEEKKVLPGIWETVQQEMPDWEILSPARERSFFRSFPKGIPRQMQIRLCFSGIRDADVTNAAAASDTTRSVREQLIRNAPALALEEIGERLEACPQQHFYLDLLREALESARSHQHRRVILAFPHVNQVQVAAYLFTRLLDPSGQTFLESHSYPTILTAGGDREIRDRHRILAETWDPPVIVTTGVELLGSLFSSDKNRLRKLHSVPNSTLLLSEVENEVPPHLQPATAQALEALVEHAGCATITRNRKVRTPIIRDVLLSWDDLAGEIQGLDDSVLVCCNTIEDAQHLAYLLGDESYHLSSRLRLLDGTGVIDETTTRIGRGKRTLLVTSPVGSYLTIRFPYVYRAAGPLEKLTGGLQGTVRTTVFTPENWRVPPGPYGSRASYIYREILSGELRTDTFESPAFRRVYQSMFSQGDENAAAQIQRHIRHEDFSAIDQDYQLIPNYLKYVIVPHDHRAEVDDLIHTCKHGRSYGGRREAAHRLRAFIVPLPTEHGRPWNPGSDYPLWSGSYDRRLGICL